MASNAIKNIPLLAKKIITCCFGDHYAYDASVLPCGGHTCKKCADKINVLMSDLTCRKCNKNHNKYDYRDMKPALYIKNTIETYMDDLRESLIDEIKKTTNSFKGLYESVNDDIDQRFENIEFELDARIESIIAGLHEYREDFMKEMNDAKEKFKRNSVTNEFKEARIKLENTSIDELRIAQMDYEGFMRVHYEFNETKAVLNKHLHKLNSIKFKTEKAVLFKDVVGDLVMPFWKFIEREQSIFLCDSDQMSQLCMQNERKCITLNDNYLLSFDFNDYSEKLLKIDEVESPRAFCIGKNEEIIIFDAQDVSIVVFDKDFEYTNSIQLDHSKPIQRLIADLYDEKNLIYIFYGNSVDVVNIDNNQIIRSIELDTSKFIKFDKDFMYVINGFSYDTTETGHSYSISGDNSILILNKSNYEIVDKIQFDDWLQPRGLDFDENGNLLTLAKVLDKNNAISRNYYLHVINKNKEIMQRVKINDETCIEDMVFLNNRLYLLYKTEIAEIKLCDF